MSAETSEQIAVPPNLIASPLYLQVLESMIHVSPTFRRQCLRIAAEPRLTIRLELAPTTWMSGARAVTRIARQPRGWMSATIEIGSRGDDVELIAHELEHIIEQLDDVDLAYRAGLPDGGVWAVHVDGTVYETVRAVRVGLKVAQEVRTLARRTD